MATKSILEHRVAILSKLRSYTTFPKSALFIPDTWENDGLLKAASIVNFQEGFAGVMVLVLDHIATAFCGPFTMVLLSTIAYVIGLVLLWHQEPANKVWIFYVAVLLIAMGKAGRKPLLKAFLADQLRNGEEESENVVARTNIWWACLSFLAFPAAIFGMEIVNWTNTFKITAIVMGVGLAIFLLGFTFYHHESPTGRSPLTTLYLVLKAALSSMNLPYPHDPNGYYMNDSNDVQLSPHILRWLDKAAIIDTGGVSPEEQERKGKLCKATQVKEVKLLLKTIPMWATFLVYCLVNSTGSTFFFEQATNLDDKIGNNFSVPSAFFKLVQSLSRYAISYLYSLIVVKWWPNNLRRSTQLRIILGMLCAFSCCVTARFVEVRRLKLVKNKGYPDIKKIGTISTHVLWLTPQFCLFGLMEGLVEDALEEFFYHQVGESMRRYGPIFSQFVLGLGEFVSIFWMLTFRHWIGPSINDSLINNYYSILAILVIANAFVFGYVLRMYDFNGARSEEQEEHFANKV